MAIFGNRNKEQIIITGERSCTGLIKRLFQRVFAYERLLKMYVEEDNHERAKDTAVLVEIFRAKAWEAVYDIYPDARIAQYEYLNARNSIRMVER